MTLKDYLRLINTIAYHNNLGVGIVNSLYENGLDLCGTERFWEEQGRSIKGDFKEIKLPVYKYRYILKSTGEPVTYKDLNNRELKQAVATGLVVKHPYISGYRDLRLTNIENTEGKQFDVGNYSVNFIKLMVEYGTYDANKLINTLIESVSIDRDILIDVEDALRYLMDNSNIPNSIPKDINKFSSSLASIIDIVDNKVPRKRLVDINVETINDVADDIICTLEALNLRKMIGGVNS